MLDDNLLDDFAQRFYGYGNYQARFWFIGMEEGGGHSVAEISERLAAWDNRGRKELEDVAEFHRAIRVTDLFDDHPRVQPTWNKLIRIVLAAGGQTYDLETIRHYQKSTLATFNGDTCLLELMPLPSRNTNTWLFSDNSSLPYLRNRDTYLSHVSPLRVAHLYHRLSRHRPQAVVFYGQQYQAYWSQISRFADWKTSPEGVTFGLRDDTVFVSAKHPAARGVTNAYFQEIGELIARNS